MQPTQVLNKSSHEVNLLLKSYIFSVTILVIFHVRFDKSFWTKDIHVKIWYHIKCISFLKLNKILYICLDFIARRAEGLQTFIKAILQHRDLRIR